MQEDINVYVVEFGDRRHYQMQYVDPVSKKKRTKSTGIPRTGKKADRDAAQKAAGKWQLELREGRVAPSKMAWTEFRERYEKEVQATKALETQRKIDAAFDLVEEILGPQRLRELTNEALSRWVSALVDSGRAAATVAIYCRHLKSALNWAHRMGFLPRKPEIAAPKVSKRMKGRPIVLEEHERMLAAVPKVVGNEAAPAWQFLLNGLWWSGLRIGEALRLSWNPAEPVAVVMQDGYHPALQFRAEGQKAHRAELVPCAPEFAQMLESIPPEKRTGRVFRVPLRRVRTRDANGETVRMLIGKIGKEAKVVVDEETRKPATAHDYRRAFGTRWAKRVMPAVLKRLMRHKNINTTLEYYVDQDVEDMAADLWAAFRRCQSQGNTLANTRPEPCEIPARN